MSRGGALAMYRCLREEVRSGVGRAPIILIGAGEVCDRVLTVLFCLWFHGGYL
jgi:hypothetical protein